MFRVGGEAWQEWNNKMRNYLATSQATEGHEAESLPTE